MRLWRVEGFRSPLWARRNRAEELQRVVAVVNEEDRSTVRREGQAEQVAAQTRWIDLN